MRRLKLFCISMQDPFRIVPELHTDELGEYGRDGFVLVCAGAAVAGEDVKVILRNAQPLGKIPLGEILFPNDLVQSITQ